MTIRKPDKDNGEGGRVTKPTPSRFEPDRRSTRTTVVAEPPPAPPPADGSAPGPVTPSEAVAAAVKRGYKVIGDNIEQGRTAAAQFRTGHYNVRNASYDLNQMSLRMLSLARELSAATIDVLEQLLQDPKFPGSTPPDPNRPSRTVKPPSFRPAPPPPQPGAPAPSTGTTATPPTGPVPLQVDVEGGRVIAATLDRPATATVLASPVLKAVASGGADITDVAFTAADDPQALRIRVTPPAGQAPGVYSGVICPQGSPVPLGLLTIEVLG